MLGPGFYKRDQDELLYGTLVTGPDFVLITDDHAAYTYPVEGWWWFEDEAQARAALNLPPLPTPDD